MNKVLRQEHKFQLTHLEYKKLCARFQLVLRQDGHNGWDGYPVRSLYFDTLTDSDFFDKQDGIEKRQKMRLRIYDPAADFAMLEMKQKQGIYQLKRSLRVSRADAIALTKGDLSVLLHYSDPFACEAFGFMSARLYRPKAIVQYNRFAFVADGNNTRVTFDSNITATESSYDLFSPNLPMYPVCEPGQVTLEVKYRDFLLGPIKDLVNGCDKSGISLSKYAMARSATLGR